MTLLHFCCVFVYFRIIKVQVNVWLAQSLGNRLNQLRYAVVIYSSNMIQIQPCTCLCAKSVSLINKSQPVRFAMSLAFPSLILQVLNGSHMLRVLVTYSL